MLRLPALLFLCSLSLLGCGQGDDKPALYKVSGKVTLDGQALSNANIMFHPAGDESSTYSATVENGEFSTLVTAGKKKVEITAFRKSATKIQPTADGQGTEPVTEEYLPAIYNKETTLTAVIEEKPKSDLTFDLKSKK
jgi:hypothetical protein